MGTFGPFLQRPVRDFFLRPSEDACDQGPATWPRKNERSEGWEGTREGTRAGEVEASESHMKRKSIAYTKSQIANEQEMQNTHGINRINLKAYIDNKINR